MSRLRDLLADHRGKSAAASGTVALLCLLGALSGKAGVGDLSIEDVDGAERIVAAAVGAALGFLALAVLTEMWPRKGSPPPPPPPPPYLDGFVNREAECGDLEQRIGNRPVSLVTGPVGAGKSRLVRQVAQRLQDKQQYRDSYYYVLLREVPQGGVPAAAAKRIPSSQDGNVSSEEVLFRWFADRPALLVFDDCDGDLEGCAGLAQSLVASCPRLKVVMTSQGLPPGLGSDTLDVRGLDVTSAVELFDKRIPPFRRVHGMDYRRLDQVKEICIRLEGLPAAIELAAGQLYGSVDELARNLDKLFTERGEDRVGSTLLVPMKLAYSRMREDERSLFRQLSVLKGDFFRDAADNVSGRSGAGVERNLRALVDRRLVSLVGSEFGESEYRMLGPLRSYARSRLEATEGADAALRRHASFFLAEAQKQELRLTSGERRSALGRLGAESQDLESALEWSLEHDPALFVPLAAHLFWYWNFRGELRDAERWLERALGLRAEAVGPTRAQLLYASGGIAFLQGTLAYAEETLAESVEIWRQHADARGLGLALLLLGTVRLQRADVDEARTSASEAVTVLRAVSPPQAWGLALALNDHGNVELGAGNTQDARALYQESLELWDQVGDRWGQSLTLDNLGSIVWRPGMGSEAEYDHAETCTRKALQIQTEDRDAWGQAWSVRSLAELDLCRQRLPEARSRFKESLELHVRLGRQQLVADCIAGLARVLAAMGETSRAAQLFGAVTSIREQLEIELWPIEASNYQQAVEGLRQQMGSKAFSTESEAGSRLVTLRPDGRGVNVDRAVNLARSV